MREVLSFKLIKFNKVMTMSFCSFEHKFKGMTTIKKKAALKIYLISNTLEKQKTKKNIAQCRASPNSFLEIFNENFLSRA